MARPIASCSKSRVIILKAFNKESFSHQGKYYTLPPAVPYRGYQLQNLTLVPRPLHRPVEVWQPW